MKKINIPKEKTFVGPALVWKRIMAFWIDFLIITLVLSFPFGKLLKGVLPREYSFSQMLKPMGEGPGLSTYFISIYLALSILTFIYFYLLEKKMSQTIGKKLMNLYIISDNGQMSIWQLLTRNLVFIPIFPFDLLFIIDPIFMIFTKSNQRLTEILSKTKVVQEYKLEL